MLLTFGILERARNHGKKSPNLVPRAADSEPLFQLSSQKSSLVQGVTFVAVFETADIRFRVPNTLLFIATLQFRFSMDGKIFCRTYAPNELLR